MGIEMDDLGQVLTTFPLILAIDANICWWKFDEYA
jgi:hypothetical protein